MPDLVVSDETENYRAQAAIADYNANTVAHLFDNNVTPDPSFVLGSLNEASYPGYSAVSLVGLWPSPALVVPGQYVSTTPSLSFASPTSGGAVTVYGAYVARPVLGFELVASFRFASPVVLNVGDPPLIVQFSYNFWARVLLP